MRFGAILLLVNLIPVKVFAADYTILVLGDSLSAGYGLEHGQSFPDQLGEKINNKQIAIKIINAGVSGDTTQGGLARLNWALADQPDMVIVELGANDGLRGIDPVLTKKNLDQIILELKKRDIDVLLAGMLAPPNMGEEYGVAFNNIFSDLAKTHGVTLYPFFLEGVAGRPDLNQDDGIHPTAKGIAVIVDGILPYVLEAMKKG